MPGPFTPTPIAGLPIREKDDYYDTPTSCTEVLLDKEKFSEHVWEPACGKGAISSVLMSRGHRVVSTDIVDRGFSHFQRLDFLEAGDLECNSIITNPPFKLADEFALHAISLGVEKMALFQRLTWIEGAKRYDRLWSQHPPIRIHAFAKRQTLWRGDDENAKSTGGTIAFAWFVWEKGFDGDPTMHWIR